MKNIFCPYDWDCGKAFEVSELNEHDASSVQSATEKKMRLTFIHCPKCSRMFSFDTVKWESRSSHAKRPVESISDSKTNKELIAILKREKTEIPSSYFEYLTSKKFKSKIALFEDEDNFSLYALDELCKQINIDGQKTIQANQLKIYSNSILEINANDLTKKEENEYLELSKCLAIGYENTRILYINYKDNNTLYVFHPDGGDSQKVVLLTMNDLIKQ